MATSTLTELETVRLECDAVGIDWKPGHKVASLQAMLEERKMGTAAQSKDISQPFNFKPEECSEAISRNRAFVEDLPPGEVKEAFEYLMGIDIQRVSILRQYCEQLEVKIKFAALR